MLNDTKWMALMTRAGQLYFNFFPYQILVNKKFIVGYNVKSETNANIAYNFDSLG